MPSAHNMNQLHRLYDRELHTLRAKIREFAREQPETAGQLDLNEGIPGDPDIARLLEGVAWLCAQLQIRLDDGYESVCRQILQLYYPDFLKPVPAQGIFRFATDALKDVTAVPRGTEFELVHNKRKFRFQTSKSLQLLPVHIERIEYHPVPLPEALVRLCPEARSALTLSLASNDQTTSLAHYLESGLELYANPNALRADEFLDTLISSLSGMIIRIGQQTTSLELQRLSWPMFGHGHTTLPCDPELSDSHRLLINFFQAPGLFRFMHLDLTGLALSDTRVEIIWLLEDEIPLANDGISKDHLLLGCTTVVNLYEANSDPVKINHENLDTPLSMGSLYPQARVREVLSVTDITLPEQPVDLPPILHASFAQPSQELSWQLNRQHDCDCLSLMTSATLPERKLLALRCLCFDAAAGNLPATVRVRAITTSLPCSISLLFATSAVRQEGLLPAGNSWDLLSTLQLNTRSFKLNINEADKLQRLLRFFCHSSDNSSLLRAIESLTISHDLRPVIADNCYYMSHGSCCQLTINGSRLAALPAVLLIHLLRHVMNFWRPVGTHSRMIACLKSGSARGNRTITFPELTDD